MRWIIGAVVALLVVVAAIVVINMVKSNAGRFNGEDRATIEQRLRLQVDACREAQDPQICARQVVVPQAELMGDAELCILLEARPYDRTVGRGDAVSGCVKAVATATMDERVCEGLDGREEAMCRDPILVQKAVASLDLNDCKKVGDEATRVACIEQVTAKVVDDGSCAEHGVDVTLCDERAAFNQAFANGDVSACDRLSDEGAVASCKDEVRQSRPDPDEGAGSSPPAGGGAGGVPTSTEGEGAFKDSDGDGYDDATEIRNGFDPYGPGRIE